MPKDNSDLLMLGLLGVGAYVLLSPQTTYAQPQMYPPISGYQPQGFIPSGGITEGGGGEPPPFTKIIQPIGSVIGTAGKVIGSAVGAIGGAVGAAGSAIGGVAVALATNPITWAIAGALGIGYLISRTQAHHKADDWVQHFQNPFDSAWGEIDNRLGTGEIDGVEATILRHALLADYVQAMHIFETKGDDYALVIRQARATFLKYYGYDPDIYLANMTETLQSWGLLPVAA